MGRLFSVACAVLLAAIAAGVGPAAAQQAPVRTASAQAAPAAAGEDAHLSPARVIRAGERIGPGDLTSRKGAVPGALRDAAAVAGLEARITLFPGRPIAPGDLAPPAMVERNQIVTLRFRRGGLVIEAEGRALDRGAEGVRVRVMNLLSRVSVTGRVAGPNLVEVGG